MENFFYDEKIKLTELEAGKNYRKVLAHGGNTMLVRVEFENGAVGASHTHPHDQISYVLEGKFEYTVENETKIIGEGDSVFIQSNAVHGCRLLSDKGVLLDVFSPQREDFLK